MEVSLFRQKVGRTVLGLLGAAGVALGGFGAFGIHSTGPRFLAAQHGKEARTGGVDAEGTESPERHTSSTQEAENRPADLLAKQRDFHERGLPGCLTDRA